MFEFYIDNIISKISNLNYILFTEKILNLITDKYF